MTSTIKVNNIQNQCGANIINENSNTITLGASGDTIALASGASQTGFGRTGTVDWNTTPKTATFSAVSGDGFFCNTTSGGFTANLPAGVAGAIVSFADYAGTWQTGNLTVSPNGSDKIGGVNSSVILNTEGQSVTFVYVDGTQGWINTMDSTSNERGSAFITATGGTITTCGNDKIHTFTGPGTFTVSQVASCAANNVVSHMVIGGGGGGGYSCGGGGGGAGGYREVKSPVTPYTASPLDGYPSAPNRVTVTATAFPITVGGGGAGGTPSTYRGTNGVNSTFSTITSAGGGGGGGYGGNPGTPAPTGSAIVTGANGGSGGGAGGICWGNQSGASPYGQAGGTGNTPPVTPAQGTNGASARQAFYYAASGGGGAIAAGSQGTGGQTAPTSAGGAGGNGTASSITGSPVTRAGGGGGSAWAPGSGGSGGGGNGRHVCGPEYATTGTINTGGGGGGGKAQPSGACSAQGGSGIVVIRYKFQ